MPFDSRNFFFPDDLGNSENVLASAGAAPLAHEKVFLRAECWWFGCSSTSPMLARAALTLSVWRTDDFAGGLITGPRAPSMSSLLVLLSLSKSVGR